MQYESLYEKIILDLRFENVTIGMGIGITPKAKNCSELRITLKDAKLRVRTCVFDLITRLPYWCRSSRLELAVFRGERFTWNAEDSLERVVNRRGRLRITFNLQITWLEF